MGPYLELEIGDRNLVRGRAIISVERTDVHPNPTTQRLLEIDGASLKEAIYSEILGGRLISLDLFEPFFVNIAYPTGNLNHEECRKFASQDSRDLVYLPATDLEQIAPERALEQLIARYTTLYKEATYLRVAQQIANELFHLRKRSVTQFYYDHLLNLACWICIFTRARREEIADVIFPAQEAIQALQPKLLLLDMKKIGHTLQAGNAASWYEMANYVDAFFLTLKKHFPMALENGNYMEVKQEGLTWLSEGVPALLEDYFLALLREEYEKAKELKVLIEECHTSQSLEGRANS